MLGERLKKELNWGTHLFLLQNETANVQAKLVGLGKFFLLTC